jgi:hypothetical protein
VFFLTASKLSLLDYDTELDVYDAHECSAVSPCSPVGAAVPAACDTEASCKAAPSLQPEIFGPSGSATFSGPGNLVAPKAKAKTAAEVRAEHLAKALKACKKDKRKAKRKKCEKTAHKHYGVAARAKRSIHGKGSK